MGDSRPIGRLSAKRFGTIPERFVFFWNLFTEGGLYPHPPKGAGSPPGGSKAPATVGAFFMNSSPAWTAPRLTCLVFPAPVPASLPRSSDSCGLFPAITFCFQAIVGELKSGHAIPIMEPIGLTLTLIDVGLHICHGLFRIIDCGRATGTQ